MAGPSGIREEALRRFVRARAPDFDAPQGAELEAWLAADERHCSEYAALEAAWRRLDGLSGHAALRLPLPPRRRVGPAAWLAGSLGAGLAFVMVLALLPGPSTRHFETAGGEHRVVTVPGGIEVTLDADTAIDLAEGVTTRLRLVRGNIYVAVGEGRPGRIEVLAGAAAIRDFGTRFAVAAAGDGGSVAVEEGRVQLDTAGGRATIEAGGGAEFDGTGRIGIRPLAAASVAPWRNGHWVFDAAPLSTVAGELSRRCGIRLDIDGPEVAALPVSGDFGFAEAKQLLWAASQVHGLVLDRIGERHYRLRRR